MRNDLENQTRALGRSFLYAFRGIRYCIKNERNMRIHLAAAVFVTAFSLVYRLEPLGYAVLFLAMGAVISFEAVNTALEALVNLASPAYHNLARIAKDVAAGAVFMAALAAIAAGVRRCSAESSPGGSGLSFMGINCSRTSGKTFICQDIRYQSGGRAMPAPTMCPRKNDRKRNPSNRRVYPAAQQLDRNWNAAANHHRQFAGCRGGCLHPPAILYRYFGGNLRGDVGIAPYKSPTQTAIRYQRPLYPKIKTKNKERL